MFKQVLTTAYTHFPRDDSRRASIIKTSVERSKSTTRSDDITKIHPLHPSPSQDREYSHQTIFKAKMLPTFVYQTVISLITYKVNLNLNN